MPGYCFFPNRHMSRGIVAGFYIYQQDIASRREVHCPPCLFFPKTDSPRNFHVSWFHLLTFIILPLPLGICEFCEGSVPILIYSHHLPHIPNPLNRVANIPLDLDERVQVGTLPQECYHRGQVHQDTRQDVPDHYPPLVGAMSERADKRRV